MAPTEMFICPMASTTICDRPTTIQIETLRPNAKMLKSEVNPLRAVGEEQPRPEDQGQEAEAVPEVDQPGAIDGHVRWLRCWPRCVPSRPATALTVEVERAAASPWREC